MSNAITLADVLLSRSLASPGRDENLEWASKFLRQQDAEIVALKQKLAEATAERDDLAIRALTIDEALTNAIQLQRGAEAANKRLREALTRIVEDRLSRTDMVLIAVSALCHPPDEMPE